nr:recombinase family protein [Bacillus nitratireducens]
MLFHIIEAVGEWERELLKEKQRAGLDIAKKGGDSWGVLVSMGRNMKGWNMLYHIHPITEFDTLDKEPVS